MTLFLDVSVIKLDGMNKEEMAAILKKFDIKSPLTNNPLTEPIGEPRHYTQPQI